MKKDAFDDLGFGSFDYGAQLSEARKALRRRIGLYVTNHPEIGVKELASAFHVSNAAMGRIVKDYRLERKIGRPPGRTVVFDLVLRKDGQKYRQLVAVKTTDTTASLAKLRRGVIKYFEAERAPVSKRRNNDGCGTWDYKELIGTHEQTIQRRGPEIEMNVSVLLKSIQERSRSGAGEVAQRFVERWILKHKGSKWREQLAVAKRALERYTALPRSD